MDSISQLNINFQVARNSKGIVMGGGDHRLRVDWVVSLDRPVRGGGVSFRLDTLPSSRRVLVKDLLFSSFTVTSPINSSTPILFFHPSQFRLLMNYFRDSLFVHNFGWFLRFNIVGYNFTLKTRFRRSLLRLNLGYSRHKFVLVAPRSVRFVTRRKRKVIVFSFDFENLFKIAKLIHNLRNIIPYKVRGLILEAGVPYPIKQGKKVKFR